MTKTVAKSINPHYNANMYFEDVSYEMIMGFTIHLAILGK